MPCKFPTGGLVTGDGPAHLDAPCYIIPPELAARLKGDEIDGVPVYVSRLVPDDPEGEPFVPTTPEFDRHLARMLPLMRMRRFLMDTFHPSSDSEPEE